MHSPWCTDPACRRRPALARILTEERKQRILSAHVPEPLSPELAGALDEIVAAARRELAETPDGG